MVPFMQSSTAKDIIANNKDEYAYNTNSAGMFRNPMYDIRTQQELAGELDPTALYPNPITDTIYPNEPEPDPYACGLGETYDPYLQKCVPIVDDLDNSRDREETKTFSERAYDRMARDVTDPYGAGNEIDKYFESEDADGRYYNFDPSFDPGFPNPLINLGLQFGDKLFGGPERREDRFRTAVDTIYDQTSFKNRPPYYVKGPWPYLNNPLGTNPFAFGMILDSNRVPKYRNFENIGEIYQMFSPEKYLDRVGSTKVLGNNQSTVDDLLRSMENAESSRSNQQGTPIAVDMTGSTPTGNSLRNDDGSRNDTNYKATVAKNIGRNIGSSNTSKFSEKLGGFYGGR